MKTQCLTYLALGLLVLSGCATPEYKAAYQTCSPGAYSQYPEDIVQSFERRQRWVRVPTGQLSCTTVQEGGHTRQTLCTPVTFLQSVMVVEPVIVDRNEEPRRRLISGCAKSLCIQRFGNSECKPAEPAPTQTPAPTDPPASITDSQ